MNVRDINANYRYFKPQNLVDLSHLTMSIDRTYVFVIWGTDFNEAMASVLVSQMRRVGLNVKLVGLSDRLAHGIRGLALVPDMTLEEAIPLATQTKCLIIPATAASSSRLNNDPRITGFIHQVLTICSQIILSDVGLVGHLTHQNDLNPFMVLSDGDEMIAAVRQIAQSLITNNQ